MTAAQPDPRKAALERVAKIQEVPVEQLAIWPLESSIKLERSVWMVHNKEINPPMHLRIAVDKTGRTLWLNKGSDPDELFRFMHAEGLVTRFAHTPERLIEVFLAFYGYNDRLLRSLDDIEDRDIEWIQEKDRGRIASLRDQFYPPEVIPGQPLKLDFWTWRSLGGTVARWHVEIGNGTGDIIYDKVMDSVGFYIPFL